MLNEAPESQNRSIRGIDECRYPTHRFAMNGAPTSMAAEGKPMMQLSGAPGRPTINLEHVKDMKKLIYWTTLTLCGTLVSLMLASLGIGLALRCSAWGQSMVSIDSMARHPEAFYSGSSILLFGVFLPTSILVGLLLGRFCSSDAVLAAVASAIPVSFIASGGALSGAPASAAVIISAAAAGSIGHRLRVRSSKAK